MKRTKKLQKDRRILSKPNLKISKGGSWADAMIYQCSAAREAIQMDETSARIGFRIAISAPKGPIKGMPKKKWKP